MFGSARGSRVDAELVDAQLGVDALVRGDADDAAAAVGRHPAARSETLPPSRGLAVGVTASLSAGVLLPFTPLAGWLAFVPLPPMFFAFLVVMTLGYLTVVEIAKRRFYRGAGI